MPVGKLQTYKIEKKLREVLKEPIDLGGLLLYPNISVKWKPAKDVDMDKVIMGACDMCCARDMMKHLRCELADPVIKGGRKKVGTFPNEMNKQAERLRELYGRAPFVYEVEQEMLKNLNEIVDFDDNVATKHNGNYLKMARGMFDVLTASRPDAMVFGRAEIRDGLHNLEIDKYLRLILEDYPGARMIPTDLATEARWEQLDKVIAEGPQSGVGSGKIIWVVNTSTEPPGEHWQAICVDLKEKQAHLYCSCNNWLEESTYNPMRRIVDKYHMPLWTPLVCSQKGNADCGVFATLFCSLFLDDKHERLAHIPLPDHNLCAMRKEIEESYKGAV